MLNPWKNLSTGDAKRVDPNGKHDFFWVKIDNRMPGLMLRLNSMPQQVPHLPKLKYLVASFREVPNGSAFVLGLKELSQIDIFETLCRDVISAGEKGKDTAEALSRTLQRTRRWHHLLRKGRNSGLSIEEQSGLVGELAFLRDLINGIGTEAAIEAWKGPSGAVKDFELIGTCIEIKSRRVAAKPTISISSENQLADVDGSRLFLRIINVASAVIPKGRSLHDHVQMTAEMFEREDGGVFDIWEDTLYSTGYDPENSYDERRWLLGSTINYEIIEGFPRITSPLIQGVQGVRYSLSLDACERFRFDDDLIGVIKRKFQK